MLLLFAFAMLFAQPPSDPVEIVPIGAAFTRAYDYINKPIQLCGKSDKGFLTAKYVYEVSKGSTDRFGIDVDGSIEGVKQEDGRVCFTC